MKIKNLIDEDFVNYKKPSMFIIFPHCSFKCDKENGTQICQNWSLVKEPDISIRVDAIVERYLKNPITSAIVCGGLEPFEDFYDLFNLITNLRFYTKDDIIIYTGYKEEEIADRIRDLKGFGNIIIKFGRYLPGYEPHYDEVLGVKLASPNQYAKVIE